MTKSGKGRPPKRDPSRGHPRERATREVGDTPHGSPEPEDRSLQAMLEELRPHDHLCLIYESPEEWRAAVVPFIRIGLERGERCMYVVDTHAADEVRRHLADAGVDVPSVEGSGRLSILKESEAYTQGGTFDPDRMIALLIEETQKAISEGYPALRITGEMTWVLRGALGAERVLEYEAKLNRDLFPHHPCLALCQYDRWAFDPEIIKGVVMTHPLLIRKGQVYRNFYYIPPEEFLNAKRAERQVQHWLNNLERERETWGKLRAVSSRQEAILAAVPDIIAEVNTDKVYTWMNRAGFAFFGEDALGKEAAFFFEGEQDVYDKVSPLFKGDEEVIYVESWQRRKDGQSRLLAWWCRALKDGQGNVTGALSTARDITERKQAQHALEASETRYRRLFEAAHDGILILDAGTGKIVDANPFLSKLTGYSREEFLDKHLWEIGPLKDIATSKGEFAKLQAKEHVRYEHLPLKTTDGRRIDVEFISNVYHVDGQRVIQCNIRDITDRRLAEEALKQSETRHRQLFEESPVALLEEDFSAVKREMDALRASGVTDLGAYFEDHPDVVRAWIEKIRVVRTNRAARELFAMADDEGVLAHLASGAPSPFEDVLRSEFIDLFSGDTGRSYRGQGEDLRGNTLETLVRLTVVQGHEEELDRVLVSIEDVTEQERAREQIEQSYRQVRSTFEGTVTSLSAMSEARDPYTAGHQRRVAHLACAIAERLGMDEERIAGLRVAALLHDIGKVAVPAEILNKPTKLSELEFSMIREHPKAGSDILRRIDFPWPVAEITLHHHERLDGSGYPQGLKGDEALTEAQILAVADVVEAMASHRPYRPALGVDAALAEIRSGAGILYNADAVSSCVALFAEGFALDGEERTNGGEQTAP